MYMTVKQAAEKWGISDRRIRILCLEGKILGVTLKDVVGRFLHMRRNRRTVGIKLQIIYLQ